MILEELHVGLASVGLSLDSEPFSLLFRESDEAMEGSSFRGRMNENVLSLWAPRVASVHVLLNAKLVEVD